MKHVKDCMHKGEAVAETAPVIEVAGYLIKHKYSGVALKNSEGQLSGFLHVDDFAHALANKKDLILATAGSIARPKVDCVKASMTEGEAVDMLIKTGRRVLPVVDNYNVVVGYLGLSNVADEYLTKIQKFHPKRWNQAA